MVKNLLISKDGPVLEIQVQDLPIPQAVIITNVVIRVQN